MFKSGARVLDCHELRRLTARHLYLDLPDLHGEPGVPSASLTRSLLPPNDPWSGEPQLLPGRTPPMLAP
ncbi:hypothetical protein BH18VER2_BH18VER2_01930 [soil metagenome]